MNRSVKVAGMLAYTSVRKGNIGVIVLTVFILVLVSLNLLFVPSLLDGLVSGANNKLINTYSGDLLVEPNGASPPIPNADALVADIEKVPGVKAATPRTTITAQLDFQNHHTATSVYGVRPDSERQVFKTSGYMIEGSYLSPGDTDSIVLGVQQAGAGRPNLELYGRSLQDVHAGDAVMVTFGNGVQKQYNVKGIYYTEFIQTDLQAHVTQTELASISKPLAGKANTIHIKLAPGADTAAVIDAVKNAAPDLRVMTWENYAGVVRSMTDSFHIIDVILNVVNLLVAGITIFIVTYIDVASRRRQIGIQRALGITPASVTMSYIMRALFYSLLALGAAALLFIYVIIPVEGRYPFHFPFGNVYLRVVPSFFLRMAAAVLGVSIVAAFIPVQQVIKVKIIDAIWG